jgi:2-polyprenyl-3-methyl-5-hydroxy-6-metoxy-1,4-benzoquinol methylase
MIGRRSARYAGEPRRVRAHITLRWWSCPFDAVLNEVPQGSSVLDYGCGHGLLSLEAGLRRRATVLGVDIDPKKVAVARRAATSAVCFDLIRPGEIPAGRWDVICLVDVLYLLSPQARQGLLGGLMTHLAPGGVLIVKEMDSRPLLKAAWMRLQEQVMVRLLGLTMGESLSFTPAGEIIDGLRSLGLEVRSRPIHSHYPHPHHLVVGRLTEALRGPEGRLLS